jgi:hypothetical protein
MTNYSSGACVGTPYYFSSFEDLDPEAIQPRSIRSVRAIEYYGNQHTTNLVTIYTANYQYPSG